MRLPKFQVSVARAPRTPRPETDPSNDAPSREILSYYIIAQESAMAVAKYVALGVAGYLVLDTARQCAIKATPQR